MKIVAGQAMQAWARDLAQALGCGVVEATVQRFADGELAVRVEGDVQGETVAAIGCGALPIHDHLMEILLLGDAAKRQGAAKVCGVVPYLPYARQDREVLPGTAVSAAVVGGVLAAAFDEVLTMDIHSEAALRFLGQRGKSVSALPLLARTVAEGMPDRPLCVVAPDAGSMARAEAFAGALRAAGVKEVAMAMVDKRRERANEVASATLVGEVGGQHCVLVDDMIDTAGTLCAAADALQAGKAASVSAAAVHGVLSGPAVRRLMGAGFERIWLGDTLPLGDEAKSLRALRVVPVAGVVAKALRG
ncbi:MAG: ribose-phosphate diphosphokinase [Proteobacteria bacterium]|nr:ribose-phosphate diphosphokinase [Pseudomonadota bacterium]